MLLNGDPYITVTTLKKDVKLMYLAPSWVKTTKAVGEQFDHLQFQPLATYFQQNYEMVALLPVGH